MTHHAFQQREIDAVYQAIFSRRDMRHFKKGGSISPECMQRLLEAAHAAPSVGYMQPWRFIRITDPAKRKALQSLVEKERLNTARALDQRGEEFLRLKVEGLQDCAEVLVTCLTDHREPHIFGRRTLPQMDLASAACAIQNIWLAARAEGLGMGWVSLFEPRELAVLLGLPEGAEAIAILCLGPVDNFYEKPMLEQQGWDQRRALKDLVMENHWQGQ